MPTNLIFSFSKNSIKLLIIKQFGNYSVGQFIIYSKYFNFEMSAQVNSPEGGGDKTDDEGLRKLNCVHFIQKSKQEMDDYEIQKPLDIKLQKVKLKTNNQNESLDFLNFIMQGYYYVDKSKLLPFVLNSKVNIICHPEQTGKSLLLSAAIYYLQKPIHIKLPNQQQLFFGKQKSKIFKRLQIADNTQFHQQYFMKHICLKIDFKQVKGRSLEIINYQIIVQIKKLYTGYQPFLRSKSTFEKNIKILNSITNISEVGRQGDWKAFKLLLDLILMLQEYQQQQNEQVIVFFDHFDASVIQALVNFSYQYCLQISKWLTDLIKIIAQKVFKCQIVIACLYNVLNQRLADCTIIDNVQNQNSLLFTDNEIQKMANILTKQQNIESENKIKYILRVEAGGYFWRMNQRFIETLYHPKLVFATVEKIMENQQRNVNKQLKQIKGQLYKIEDPFKQFKYTNLILQHAIMQTIKNDYCHQLLMRLSKTDVYFRNSTLTRSPEQYTYDYKFDTVYNIRKTPLIANKIQQVVERRDDQRKIFELIISILFGAGIATGTSMSHFQILLFIPNRIITNLFNEKVRPKLISHLKIKDFCSINLKNIEQVKQYFVQQQPFISLKSNNEFAVHSNSMMRYLYSKQKTHDIYCEQKIPQSGGFFDLIMYPNFHSADKTAYIHQFKYCQQKDIQKQATLAESQIYIRTYMNFVIQKNQDTNYSRVDSVVVRPSIFYHKKANSIEQTLCLQMYQKVYQIPQITKISWFMGSTEIQNIIVGKKIQDAVKQITSFTQFNSIQMLINNIKSMSKLDLLQFLGKCQACRIALSPQSFKYSLFAYDYPVFLQILYKLYSENGKQNTQQLQVFFLSGSKINELLGLNDIEKSNKIQKQLCEAKFNKIYTKHHKVQKECKGIVFNDPKFFEE